MSKEEFEFIGKKIFKNRVELARLLNRNILEFTKEHSEKFTIPESEYLNYRSQLIGYLGEALYKNEEEVFKSVGKWAKDVADLTIRYGISLTQVLRVISLFRLVIWEIFTEELEQNRFSCKTIVEIASRFDKLIDSVFRITGEVHERHYNGQMKSAFTELEELSVPVVSISSGIAVLAVRGSVDYERAHRIMEISLNEATRLNLNFFIMDLSGVSNMDSVVANSLFQIVKTLRLIGVEIIITGVRPSIAHVINRTGINFNPTEINSSVENALSDLGFKQVSII
ncbi:STAS domain-containing protein [Bacillus sp. ISL-35]|uniref:STAS domain-containing protein n=1 Tax=Bacillus sp. ISL-35 TaxID=2819122 RepID=UPI001BE58028|nr:STAS domain-containing protein [Bacillus sp. ISL-35]MBT2679327.1 STAS domain-containing protein [Bacillus sp. ISL-35]MBT2703225.1 STAS domain-containing protein [Chryseobacterium sp. ISL-80]